MDAKPPYEVERSARHAERPGFRIIELEITTTQRIPWHHHTNVHDTFYVLQGCILVSARDPAEEVRLSPGETCAIQARRPHQVTNAGEGPAVFLVLQGLGQYDFVPLS